MNPFASRITHNQAWVIPVSALSLVLGFMFVMVNASMRSSRLRPIDADIRDRLTPSSAMASPDAAMQQQLLDKSVEINKLREEKTNLENSIANVQKSAAKLLNDSLQDVKLFAGLTEVKGPGVLVTLNDGYSAVEKKDGEKGSGDATVPDELQSEDVIHDQDILRVVNELYAAGVEAVSINNLRLVGTSSIRCVGPTVLIDGVRIAAPIKIRGIGDTETIMGGLTMPGGIIDELKQVNPRMVTIESVKSMTLPAYTGPTSRKFAKVAKGTK